ncbi:hypothetical protein [Bacillus sp. HMF5848]|uniref:hypothetical protein n=1 Tax=Bacillus sp. HMF5848 TaxID=2495421 RepID=UPI001639E7F0|nr:hypothetical protein [Bacillus sp. HMF5848]
MDFYHMWLYESVLNTKWFMWFVAIAIFAFNILAPILVWFIMNSKAIPFINKKKQQS